MNIQEQTLFKSFIEGQGLREVFLKGYRRSAQFAKNPSSVEKYLSTVKAEDAIEKAICTYTTNSHFGFDFWQNASESWNVYLNKGRAWHSLENFDKLMTLDGIFKVMRENWDAAKTWLYEDVDKALVRLGLAMPEGEERESVVEDTKPTDIKDFSGVPEADGELEFFDLNAGSRTRTNKLRANEATLNFRSHSNKFTFNQTASKKIQKNQYKYVRLAKNKLGDIVLQLHKVEMSEGRQVTVTYNTASNSNTVNACINSKDLCTKLKTLLNLSGDLFTLHIEELFMDFDKANYKISK